MKDASRITNVSAEPQHHNSSFSTDCKLTAWTTSSGFEKFLVYYLLFIILLTICANGVFILAYSREPRLHTSFNLYLLNLSLADLFYACFDMSGEFIASYFPCWPLTRGSCTFWLYSRSIFPAAQVNSILLVALERLVALYWPLWYHTKFNRKVSLIIIASMWLWLNLYGAPAVLKSRFAKTDEDVTCTFGEEFNIPAWVLCMNIFLFVLPHTVLIVCYCAIAKRMRSRRRNVALSGDLSGVAPTGTSAYQELGPISHALELPSAALPMSAVSSNVTILQPNFARSLPDVKPKRRAERRRLEQRAFYTLTALTVTVTVCWLPADVYWFLVPLRGDFYSPFVDSLTSCMQYTVAALNPLFYHFLNRDIRRAVVSLFGFG